MLPHIPLGWLSGLHSLCHKLVHCLVHFLLVSATRRANHPDFHFEKHCLTQLHSKMSQGMTFARFFFSIAGSALQRWSDCYTWLSPAAAPPYPPFRGSCATYEAAASQPQPCILNSTALNCGELIVASVVWVEGGDTVGSAAASKHNKGPSA